jgi:hypothetical protein
MKKQSEKHFKDIDMTSSGGVKDHRQVQPLPEDYYTPGYVCGHGYQVIWVKLY